MFYKKKKKLEKLFLGTKTRNIKKKYLDDGKKEKESYENNLFLFIFLFLGRNLIPNFFALSLFATILQQREKIETESIIIITISSRASAIEIYIYILQRFSKKCNFCLLCPYREKVFSNKKKPSLFN